MPNKVKGGVVPSTYIYVYEARPPFNLIGHWALDLRALCANMCSIGPMALAQISLGTLPKLKNHNDIIIT